MVVDVTVKCDHKDKFIHKILQLDEAAQMGLMNCIQNNELLLKLTKEQSSLDENIVKEKDNPVLHFLSFNSQSTDLASQNCSFSNIEKINLNLSFNSPNSCVSQSLCEEEGKLTIETPEKLQSRVKALEYHKKISKKTQSDLLTQIKEQNDEKKRLVRENGALTPAKKKHSRMPKEAIELITNLEAELDRAKTEIIQLKDKNRASETLYSKYFDESSEEGYFLNDRLDSLTSENDSLKSKLVDLQTKANLSEAYKIKLEKIIEYKNKYESLQSENEDLKKEIFNFELQASKERSFQEIYEDNKQEFLSAKAELHSCQIELKTSRGENIDLCNELTRQTKSYKNQEMRIKQLKYELSLAHKEYLQEPSRSETLAENLKYEAKIKALEQEVIELRIQNDDYANSQLIKLELALDNQKKETEKTQAEKGYYEERCSLLETQNYELKNRINSLKEANQSTQIKLLQYTSATAQAQELSLRLASMTTRLQTLEQEKAKLQASLSIAPTLKDQLQSFFDENLKSLNSVNQFSKPQNSSTSPLSGEEQVRLLKSQANRLRKELLVSKMENKIYKTVFTMVTKLDSNSFLHICVRFMKMCYVMFVKVSLAHLHSGKKIALKYLYSGAKKSQ